MKSGSKANEPESVYEVIELTGTSTVSMEHAVNRAIKRAHQTVKNLRWFEVVDVRGSIDQAGWGTGR